MITKPNRTLQFLQENQIAYRILPTQQDGSLQQMASAAQIDIRLLVRAVLLQSEQGFLCVVLPAQNVIDFDALKNYTGTTYQPSELSSAHLHFPDCKAHVIPPFAFLYDIEVFFDHSLSNLKSWIIDTGLDQTLIEICEPDKLNFVIQDHSHDFSTPEDALAIETTEHSPAIKTYAPENTATIDGLYTLPVCPQLVQLLAEVEKQTEHQLLENFLHEHPDYMLRLKAYLKNSVFNRELSESMEVSPNYLISCLGSRLVTILLRGLVIWNESPLPADGPLGKQSLFQHASVAPQVAYKLVTFAHGINSIEPVTACAITINQNIGYLLLYWLFKPEYFLFNRMLQVNKRVSVLDIEKQFLAYGHASQLIKQGHAHAGYLLMDKWGFADCEKTVCQKHHDLEYRGKFEYEVHLVILVNYLLRKEPYGDTTTPSPPDKSIRLLGLTQAGLAEFCAMMAEYDIALSA